MLKYFVALCLIGVVLGRPHFAPHFAVENEHFLGHVAITHGCYGGFPTHNVSMTFPEPTEEQYLVWVHPQYMPDWNIEVQYRPLPKVHVGHTHNVTETVSKITWTPIAHGPVPYNFLLMLGMRFHLIGYPAGERLTFNITQECPGTTPLVWSPEHHPPTLHVVNATAHHHVY